MCIAAAIAIDGPVASGKTVVGRLVAERLGCRFLDTGVMYRAATLAAICRGVDLENAQALCALAEGLEMRLIPGEAGDRLVLDGRDVTDRLRGAEVERGVSLVARVGGVRRAMVRQQRAIAEKGPIVMVGRDIGTVVLPDAQVKVFLVASVEVRAQRRYSEMAERGLAADLQQVKEELLRRDKIDTERADSPLRPASDALQIDTDRLSVEQVVQQIMSRVERA